MAGIPWLNRSRGLAVIGVAAALAGAAACAPAPPTITPPTTAPPTTAPPTTAPPTAPPAGEGDDSPLLMASPSLPPIEIGPADSLQNAVRAAQPGQVVRLRAGTYPIQLVENLALTNVVVWGADKATVVVPQFELRNVSGLTIGNLTVTAADRESSVRLRKASHHVRITEAVIRPKWGSGVDISESASNITVDRVSINGSAQTTTLGRGVRVLNEGTQDTWSHDIVVRDSDIQMVSADGFLIGGVRNMTIERNYIHDLQVNDDHNDGVQTVGSIGLRIVGNRFRSPGDAGPDQAIILGRSPTNANFVVQDTYVANNIVNVWRGSGILLGGTDRTTVVSNSVIAGGIETNRASSLVMAGSSTMRNTAVRAYNNALFSIYIASPYFDWWEDYNCVQRGAQGPHDVKADPKFANPDTLQLAADSPCRTMGYRDSAVPATNYGGATRVDPFAAGAW